MSFEFGLRPRGHGATLESLWRAADAARLPHSLLFCGPEGIGKFLAARWFAAGLFCREGPGWPCGRCGPCKRVAAGSHPDLFVVDAVAAGESALTVAFISPREGASGSGYSGPSIGEFLSLRPMEGGARVVVVREAERMNAAAQNAFLKTLEEPGRESVLLLECSSPAALLDTIKSRVVPVALEPLGAEETEAVLAEVAPEALPLARWCAGAPGVALRLAERGAPALREALLEVASGECTAQEAAARVWEAPGDFPGKTPAAQRRLRVATLLDLGLDLWLDLERKHAGVAVEELAQGDVLGRLPPQAAVLREERLAAWLTARGDIDRNLSAEAILDRALAAAVPRNTR